MGLVLVISMWQKENKIGIYTFMALSTGFYEPFFRNGGLGVRGRELFMRRVAVRTSRYVGGIPEAFNPSVIAFFIGFNSGSIFSCHFDLAWMYPILTGYL